MILRDYQEQCVQAALLQFDSVQSTLCVMPTGTGKMLIGAEIIRRMRALIGANEPISSLFVAHREELLHQAQKTTKAHAELDCEFELGNSRASEIFPADVLLASVQTLISGRKGERRVNKFSPYNYNLLVIDEAHHATAASYREIIDYFKANKDIKILGLTATPNRTDEEALGQVFDTVAFDYTTLQAIKDGWLVPIQQQLINIQGLDFSHIRTTAGDLNTGDLAAVMEQERNLYGICDAARKEAGNQKAIMFCVTVKHAQMAADILNRYQSGIAVSASGKTPKEDRRRIIRDFREGRYQFFVNCDLVGEGFDMPDASVLIDGAPTKSLTRYQQRLGRIMRPLSGVVDFEGSNAGQRIEAIKNSTKPVATVIDFTGNAGRHKLIHAVDVLGGNISARTRELIERKLRETGVPEQIDALVLEAEKKEAEEKIRAERARKMRLTGKATYTIRTIDPFDAFDCVKPPEREWNRGKALSTKQREILGRQGLDPDRMSYAEGQTILNEIFRRWNSKLSTLKQSACLKRYGYDTKDLTKDQATMLITQLKENGWKRQ